jgi:hypothetical protein
MTIALPTIHLNGTSAESLRDQYETALRATMRAVECLSDAAPNGRDYYTQGPDVGTRAAKEHAERLEKLLAVQRDLQALFEHTQEAVNAEEERRGTR